MLLRSVCRYSCTPLTLKISARRGARKKLAGNRFIKGEALMFKTPTTPPEVHVQALKQAAHTRQVFERAAATSLRSWEAPLAYLLGAALAGIVYFAQGNAFVALAAGAAVAALSLATACFAVTLRTHAAVQALIRQGADAELHGCKSDAQ